MKRISLLLASLLCIPGSLAPAQQPNQNETAKIRIGVYESRAIAVAWAASRFNPVEAKMKEYQVAKDSNDTEKIAELEAWGPAHQRMLHFQGFGRVPVGELLLPVRNQIKQLMADQNLAALAMQCDEVGDNVQLVDVTMDLVKLYDPSEKTVAWVKQMRDQQPLTLLELADQPADK